MHSIARQKRMDSVKEKVKVSTFSLISPFRGKNGPPPVSLFFPTLVDIERKRKKGKGRGGSVSL